MMDARLQSRSLARAAKTRKYCVPQPYSSRSSRRSSVSISQGAVPIRAEAAARSTRVACELSQRKLPHARMRKKCMIDGYAAMLQARSQRHSRHCKRHSCTERCFCLSLSPICVSLVCMTIKRERERARLPSSRLGQTEKDCTGMCAQTKPRGECCQNHVVRKKR